MSVESLDVPSSHDLIKNYVRQACLNERVGLSAALMSLERDIILHVLTQTNGNQRDAAAVLRVKPNTLHYRLRRLGITPVRRFD